jgi:SAM-dependent methyltransferase
MTGGNTQSTRSSLQNVTRKVVSPIIHRLTSAARGLYYRRVAQRIVRSHVGRGRDKYEDRSVLELIIIPFVLSRLNPRRVLDIGREPYGAFYNEFYAGRELWTIDWNPAKARFGASNHVVDDVANLRMHFPGAYFDFVLMNGVFGWGLNERVSIEQAFSAVHAILRPGGLFVLGWNDTPDLVPVPLAQVVALQDFTPCHFPPLHATSFKCATGEHTYSFFTKERSVRASGGDSRSVRL